MKRYILLAFLLLGSFQAHAAICSISNGSSVSTINSALSSAASGGCNGTVTIGSANSGGVRTVTGGIVQLANGSYSINSQLSIPCGSQKVVFMGTPNNYPDTWTARPTAVLSSGINTQILAIAAGCSSNPGVDIYYLEFNGNKPGGAGGGGSIYVNQGNISNLDFEYNYMHGNQEPVPSVCGSGNNLDWCYDTFDATLIHLDGFNGSSSLGSLLSNSTILYNIFGATVAGNVDAGDCGNVMEFTGNCMTSSCLLPNGQGSWQGYDTDGGFCAALGVHTNTSNFHFDYNSIIQQEQGTKWFEGGNGGSDGAFSLYFEVNDTMSFNDFGIYHRIATEDQQSSVNFSPVDGTCSGPNGSCMQRLNNDLHDGYNPAFGSWSFSLPNIGYGNDNNNVMITNNNNSGSGGPGDFEFWGYGQENLNLDQGYVACASQYGYNNTNTAQVENNIIQLVNGGGCSPAFGIDDAHGNSTVIISGNTSSTTHATIQSVAPTMSPSGGSFSGSQTITFTDPGYTNNLGPQGNHGIWCTTDGSTPAPKSGTSVYYPTGGTLTIVATTTVKCVGMWGAITQPASYPSGYGFVPSSVVTANFTSGGGTPTVNAPTYVPVTGTTFGTSQSVSVSTTTSGATIRCTTDGSTPTTSSPVYTGPFTLTATTTITCFATEIGFNNSMVTSAHYTYSLFLGNNNLDVDGTTYPNAANSVYSITGTSVGGYTANSATLCMTNDVVTNGASTDVVVSTATSSTTQNTSPKCTATYTNTSAAGPGCVTIPISGCGTFAASTAYFISAITNDPLTPSPMGFWDCGGACGATAPTSGGTGTYYGLAYAINYGGPYTLPGTLGVTDSNQPTIYLNLSAQTNPTAATPVISPSSTTFTGTESVAISDTTSGAIIHYTTDGSTPTSSSPTYTATLSLTATTTVNAIAVATGFTNSPVATATYTLATATLSSAYLGTPGNANYVILGSTVQFTAFLVYTDGFQSQLTCTGSGCADTRGSFISAWTTTAPSVATISSSGIVTPVALGSTNIQANLTYSGGTTSSSPWTENVTRSNTNIVRGVTMQGITVQ